MDEIEIDKEEFTRQYQEEAQKDGLVVKVYLQNINMEKVMKDEEGLFSSPNINIEGRATPINVASMIIALEDTIEELKKLKGAKETLKILKMFYQPGTRIEVHKEGGVMEDE